MFFHNEVIQLRGIDGQFIQDLKTSPLNYFLIQAIKNPAICLEIRNGYINLYYRGGNVLKITKQKRGYTYYFDSKYCLSKNDDSNFNLLSSLNIKEVRGFINNFPKYTNKANSTNCF